MNGQALKLLRSAYRLILEGNDSDDLLLIKDGLDLLSVAINMLEECGK